MSDLGTVSDGQLANVPVALIVAGDNDRKAFDAGELESLAVSIKRDGLAQPPTIRPLPDGRFEIVAGERRIRAMRDVLGWDTVPAFVRTMSDDQAAATMLVENMVRVDLDPLEEAKAFRARIDAGGTVAELAELVGVSQRTIKSRLDLLRLGADAQALISSGNLELQRAAQMVGLDSDRQALALRALAHGELSAPAFVALCDRLRREQEAEPMFAADMFWSVEEYNETALREAELARRSSSSGPDQMLTTSDVARLIGVKVGTVRRFVCRGTFPRPDGHVGSTPYWVPVTVTDWAESRRGPGRPRQLALEEADELAG